MIILGKYDEFAPGMGFPSIREYLQNKPYKSQEAILQYLMSGNIHMVTASRFNDVITGELTDRELVYMDDGKYSWSSKLPYYVEKYNLKLPEDFERYVLKKMADKATKYLEKVFEMDKDENNGLYCCGLTPSDIKAFEEHAKRRKENKVKS